MSAEWGCAVVQLRRRCADILPALMGKAQTIGRNETRLRRIQATGENAQPSDNHRKVKTARRFRRRRRRLRRHRVVLIFVPHVSPIAHGRLLLIGPDCSILCLSIQLRHPPPHPLLLPLFIARQLQLSPH